MGIYTDWYIHDQAILARVTGQASREDVMRMDFELNQLLKSATRPAIMLLHFDGQPNGRKSTFKTEHLRSLRHKLLCRVICCGNIEAAIAKICKSPEKFGFAFDGQLFDDWDSAVAHIMKSCDNVTSLDIENAEDLFNLNYGELV